jgi:hypothetical protein
MLTRKPGRREIAVVLAAAAVCATAGCGSSSDDTSATAKATTVDSTAVEGAIAKKFSSSDTKVTNVKCPKDVQAKTGGKFKCDTTWSNGAAGKVQVTQESAGQFSSQVVAGSVQIPGESVDKTLEKQLAQQGAPNATAECPQNVIVKVGSTVTCNVSGAGGGTTGKVMFTFTSATGEVDPSSVHTG